MLEQINVWLLGLNFSETLSEVLAYIAVFLFFILIGLFLNWVAKKIILRQVSKLIQFSKTKWDDILLERGVFNRLAQMPFILLFYLASPVFGVFGSLVSQVSEALLILFIVLILNDAIQAAEMIYEAFDVSKERPIKGFLQVLQIIIFVIGGILVISSLINQSPLVLLGGLSAMTAVLLLVFQDTILGFVASIQFAANNMVRIGDWVEMPKFDADGDVIDVSVTTVKVQNWDKTITTIPTYAMVSNSFRNWRGMEESDGRRIKRSLNIDMNSIKFCDEEMLTRFRQIRNLSDYLNSKETEIHDHNQRLDISDYDLINGRHLTNIGTFRAYIVHYLRNHPDINQDMTLLVRQLRPVETGLPIEIYAFSSKKDWVDYEDVQSDIFDHLLAILPEFELQVFQNPSGVDIQSIDLGTDLPL